jgi:uncharacterized repeat protein (TIGR01451 family)
MIKKTLAPLLISAASIALFAGAASAGTQAGIVVVNTVDLSYESGADTITRPNAAMADFVVDRMVDHTLVGQASGDTVLVDQGAADQAMVFQVTNEGNDTSGYDIDVASAGAIGLTYDPTGSGNEGTYSVYTSPNATGGPDTLYDINGTVNAGDIAKDGVFYIRIVAHIPTSAEDGHPDNFTVTTTSLDAGTNTPTVESRGNGIDAEDTILVDTGADGVESDGESFVVQSPLLNASKTVDIISENLDGSFDCATGVKDMSAEVFVPGACIEYLIQVGNTGSNPAENMNLQDDLPADVTFVAITDIVNFDTVVHSAGTIDADIASLASGGSASFKVRVTLD